MLKKLLITFLVGIVCALAAFLYWGDIVTAVCIGIIMGVFIYFFQEILHLSKACTHLERLKDTNIIEENLDSDLKSIVDDYASTIKIGIGNTKKTNIPSIEFINLQSIAKIYKVNLKALDSASGMLVGLGLIGTFLGLTIGIANFDSSNSENIQNSIQTLLNGMYIAFLTSLFGMGTSIINTGFDKHWRNNLHLVIHEITDKLDRQYYIDDMDLLEYRQHQMLEFTDEDGNKNSLSSAIGHILEESKSQTAALSSFNTDLSTMLNNSLGEQIENKLSPKMNDVIAHIDKLAESVITPANDMMEKVASELKYSMSLIVTEFQKKVTDTATQQLDSISQSLTNATKAIDVLPENVTNAINSMQEAITKVEKSMITLTEDIMSKQADLLALQESTTTESRNLIESLKSGIGSLSEINDKYKNTVSLFEDTHTKVYQTLGSLSVISDNMSDAIEKFKGSQNEYAENMKSLQTQTQGNIDSISQLVSHSGELSLQYASQFIVIKDGLTGIFEKLREGLEEYSKTMQQTTQDYLQQYSRSLTETADSLKTTIDIMSDTISDFSEVVEKNKQ